MIYRVISAVVTCPAVLFAAALPAPAQVNESSASPVATTQRSGLLAGAPGFGLERDVAPAERGALEESLALARLTVDTLSTDLANRDLELGEKDAVIGRLFARLETLRRANRVPGAPATYRLSLRFGVTGYEDEASGPANCPDRSDDGQGRFATAATTTHVWHACTSLDASPGPTSATPVLLIRRSTRKGDELRELKLEIGFGYGNIVFVLAMVHDTAMDIERALRPRLRRHDGDRQP